MEGLCPDDHHGALRLQCPIQSVPQRNKGENQPSEKEILQHPRRTETPRKERGGPRHPQGDLGRSAEKVCEMTLLTG